MMNNNPHTEKNMDVLLNSGFGHADRLAPQLKEDALHLLEQKVAQNRRETKPDRILIIGLSAVWLALVAGLLYGFSSPVFLFDLVKPAVGLSLVLIPVSSVIIILLKRKPYENKLV